MDNQAYLDQIAASNRPEKSSKLSTVIKSNIFKIGAGAVGLFIRACKATPSKRSSILKFVSTTSSAPSTNTKAPSNPPDYAHILPHFPPSLLPPSNPSRNMPTKLTQNQKSPVQTKLIKPAKSSKTTSSTLKSTVS